MVDNATKHSAASLTDDKGSRAGAGGGAGGGAAGWLGLVLGLPALLAAAFARAPMLTAAIAGPLIVAVLAVSSICR